MECLALVRERLARERERLCSIVFHNEETWNLRNIDNRRPQFQNQYSSLYLVKSWWKAMMSRRVHRVKPRIVRNPVCRRVGFHVKSAYDRLT